MNLLKVCKQHLMSGWSFFFRWPSTHVEPFRPNGIFLGALFQALVVGCFCFFIESTARSLHLETVFQLRWFLGAVFLAALTGFFHEDGLADTADGLGVPKFDGSPERRQKIQAAMKDSRIGSYGAIALIVLWVLRYSLLTTETLPLWDYVGIIFWSRLLGLSVASAMISGSSSNNSTNPTSLANHALAGTSLKSRAIWTVILVMLGSVLFFKSWISLVEVAASATLVIGLLHVWSRRSGKLCGDLIGASICCSEIFLLLISQKNP